MAKDPSDQLAALIEGCDSSPAQLHHLITLGLELAQLGRCDAAAAALLTVKQRRDASSEPSVSIRCLLLEGVVRYYEGRYSEALDRVRRACLLGAGFSLTTVHAEAEVWSGHLLYNFGDLRSFARSLEFSLENASKLADASLARLCLTVADLVEYSRSDKQSNEWYSMARICSRRGHSRAVMVAIEYNRLASGLSRVRRLSLLENFESSATRDEWVTELNSVVNMHAGLGADAVPELLRMAKARVLQLQGEYLNAARLLESLQNDCAESKCGLTNFAMRTEWMWCLRRAGQASEVPVLDDQLDRLLYELDADDRVACLLMIRELVGPRAEIVEESLHRALAELREEMQEILSLANRVDRFRPRIEAQIVSD